MRSRSAVIALALMGLSLMAAPASGQAVCDTSVDTPGGDWRRFGNDVWSSRHQTQESTIGVDNVANLEVAWTFSRDDAGYLVSAVVAGNCAFFSDEPAFGRAWVYAVNVDTGELVWRQPALADVEPDPGAGG